MVLGTDSGASKLLRTQVSLWMDGKEQDFGGTAEHVRDFSRE